MSQACDGPDLLLDTYICIYVIMGTLHIAECVYSDMLKLKNIVWHAFINP